jgi:hypothetical protein
MIRKAMCFLGFHANFLVKRAGENQGTDLYCIYCGKITSQDNQ